MIILSSDPRDMISRTMTYRVDLQKLSYSSLPLIQFYFSDFSFRDTRISSSLANMAQAARLRQSTAGDVQMSETVSNLKWYSLEKAPDQDETSRIESMHARTQRLKQYGVRVIWYQDGGAPDPYRAAFEIIRQTQRRSRELTVAENDLEFVERLIEAEELASIAAPTPGQVRRAVAIVNGHPRVALAFWDVVESVEWFRSLRDAGILAPKPVLLAANGDRRAPYWMASGLLRRVASAAPSEVAQFLCSIDTDNWAAIRGAFEILEALDESSGAYVGPQFAKWSVDAMSIEPLLLYQASESSQRLNSDGKPKAALALLEAILRKLAESGLSITEGVGSDFSHAIAPILGRSEPAVEAVSHTLEAALIERCGTPEDDNVRYLRHAIEPHRMDLTESSAISLLIDVLRDALLQTKDDSARSTAVTKLLQSSWPTKRRIGIAHCFLLRSDLTIHEARVITHENLANDHLFHELAKLLSDDITDITEQRTDTLKRFVTSLHDSSSENDRFDYKLWSQVLPIELLPEPPAPIEDDFEDSDRHLFRGVYFGSVTSRGAPLDLDSFAERASTLSSDELLALVRDPAAHGVRITWKHSTSEMWSLLAEYAKARGTLDPLVQIRPEDLEGRQVWQAIEAMAEVAGDDPIRWSEVIDWASRMVSKLPADKLWPIGGLLEGIGDSIPLGLSHSARKLAMQVIEKSKRTDRLESESLEHSFVGGYLNLPAGKAMRALLELLRREIFKADTDKESLQDLPEWFKTTVLERLSRDSMGLGIDAWIGVGLYYALFCDRSPDSAESIARYLEFETSETSTAKVAFWSGHLSAPTLWTGTLERLHDAYRISARTLQADGILEDDLRDRFFQHIVIGALRNIAGYDELLLSTLSSDFTPVARGSIVFALGRAVREMTDSTDAKLQSTVICWFRRYWAKHVEEIGGQDGPQLATYLRWLKDLQLPPRTIDNLIEASLDQVSEGFEIHTVFEYLGRYAEEDPDTVLALLGRCVDWYRLRDDAWLHAEMMKDLLDQVAPLTRHEAILREVLDGLAELGAISTADVHRYLGSDQS
ncbi:MAG: hypothetical protein OXG33_03235 [Chloroflexi bacterium]|nr:hypothetical protein [Chloroflexota bacterium]